VVLLDLYMPEWTAWLLDMLRSEAIGSGCSIHVDRSRIRPCRWASPALRADDFVTKPFEAPVRARVADAAEMLELQRRCAIR